MEMDNNDKHINSKNLPQHEPNPDLWENIEQGLDKLEAVDKFKKSLSVLPVHEPASQLWDNIEVKLEDEKPLVFYSLLKRVAIIIVALLLLLVPIYFFLNNNVDKTNINESPAAKKETRIEPDKLKNVEDFPAPIEREPKAPVDNPTEISETEIIVSPKEPEENNISPVLVIHEEKAANDVGFIPETENVENNNTSASDINETSVVFARLTFLNFKPQLEYWYSPSFNSQIPLRNDIPAKAELVPMKFYTGIHYTPGLVYTNVGNEPTQKEHTLGVDIGYKFNGVFVETGIGLNFTKQDATYEIDYLQNELINTYTKVDSIIYEIDTIHAELKKNYVTSDVDVYDSINYAENTKTTNQFTYLRIPLLIGYKFDFRKISIFVKGGALFSVLLKGDESIPTVDGKEITITNVDRLSPYMITTKWQAMVSAGVAVPLNKLLIFAVEPQFRYLLSTYSDQNLQYDKRPYSIGVKVGLLINF